MSFKFTQKVKNNGLTFYITIPAKLCLLNGISKDIDIDVEVSSAKSSSVGGASNGS